MNSSFRLWGSLLLASAGLAIGSLAFARGGGAHHDAPATQPAGAVTKAPAVTPDAAMEMLAQGNDRFTSNAFEHPRLTQNRRCDTFVNGQHPFAVVLSCADSRAPVELLFDQGVGDLFVVRVAGNVADTDEIGTIEYGVGHLHAPLIVVLGHTKCGAVTAVVEGAKLPPNIAKLVDNINPAAERVKREHPNLHGEPLVAAAVRANVFQSIQDMLTNSDEIRELVAHGKVKVIGAVYDLHGGGVQWLGPHPEESRMLAQKGATAHRSDEPLKSDPHGAAKDSHAPRDAAHGPRSDARGSHQTPAATHARRGGGLLVPAAFLGGAAAVSSAVIYGIRTRGHASASASDVKES